MMMSVWRQGQPTVQLDHREILKVVDSNHDLDLIRLAMRTRHSCLIAMDDVPAIIRPYMEGDELHSLDTFAGLYDECYTVADLQRMERRGVDTPEEAVHDTHRVTIDFQYRDAFVISVRLRAESHGAARARFRALIERDTVFRQQLGSAMTLKAARRACLQDPRRGQRRR
jgi:hypothetical protein